MARARRVVSQPSLPFALSKKHRASIDTSEADIGIALTALLADGTVARPETKWLTVRLDKLPVLR
jgi:hypothetical protein